jgi:hypothetical protein
MDLMGTKCHSLPLEYPHSTPSNAKVGQTDNAGPERYMQVVKGRAGKSGLKDAGEDQGMALIQDSGWIRGVCAEQ